MMTSHPWVTSQACCPALFRLLNHQDKGQHSQILVQLQHHLAVSQPCPRSPAKEGMHSLFISYLTVWGVEPVVTHQTPWLESTGVCGVRQNQAGGISV